MPASTAWPSSYIRARRRNLPLRFENSKKTQRCATSTATFLNGRRRLGVHERLLEGWLDSAGERTYQGPFCQVLSAEGYSVLHSTRHAHIEFGKDVIAVAPDGIPCAYQLKGNPGGRLTLAQFRDIQPQLGELVSQAIVYPGAPNVRHRSYL